MTNTFVPAADVKWGMNGLQVQHLRDLRAAILPDPKIDRYLSSGTKQLVVGSCPICKIQLTEWGELKEHVKNCRRTHQYPLLMRPCYCPYCLKKVSDAYSLCAHLQHSHRPKLQTLADELKRKFREVIAVSDPSEESKMPRGRITGVSIKKMSEPFPFACSACNLCWPTAKGLADHFLAAERARDDPCGGFLSVYVRPGSGRKDMMSEEIACNRYDFASVVTCPHCDEGFDEAYALSGHFKEKHEKRRANLERQLTDSALEKFPSKKYFFPPFFCTKCHSTFKTMDEWAEHNHTNTLAGHPCNGDLRVMKRVVENARPTFRGNVHPKPADGHSPKDGQRAESIPDDPSTSGAAATTAGAVNGLEVVVVKEEPLDEEEDEVQLLHSASTSPTSAAAAAAMRGGEQTRVREKRVEVEDGESDEPQQGGSSDKDESQPPREEKGSEGKGEGDEDDLCTFDCEICGGVFHDSKTYVGHMADDHGYVLAEEEGLDEEQIARLEAGEDPGPPAAKKHKKEEEEEDEESRSPTPRYPPLSFPSSILMNRWFKCQQCGEYCETMKEYAEHRKYHSGRQMLVPGYACKVCHASSFTTLAEKKKHEYECLMVRLSQIRDQALLRHCVCRYCNLRIPNAYVLLHHMMAEHADTVEKLRKNYLMASEFLPFRCNSCNVGFEDPRLLLNHFRLREEFDIACTGNFTLHSYTESLLAAEVKAASDLAQAIPKLCMREEEEEGSSNEWCPRDPSPSADIELTGKIKCPGCSEMWPNVQLKLHVKMEHPKMYFDYAALQCKICKKYGFWSASMYADHYQSCKSAAQPGVFDLRHMAVAPRIEPSSVKAPAALCKLPGIPEEMGNEMRQCRFCTQSFTPMGLLMHQKTEHPLHHFTDAPYHCPRCSDVGFYSHEAFTKHARVCTGKMPDELVNDIFAITTLEIAIRTPVRRREVPCYRVFIDGEVRRHGTLAALNRPVKCDHCEAWCSSLWTLGEHLEDAHEDSELFLICGGCAETFRGKEAVKELKKHLENENAKGNTRCFDTAAMNTEGLFKTTPAVPTYDLNQFIRHETTTTIMPRSGVDKQEDADDAPWRCHLPKFGAMHFKNLARQEAFERRHAPPPPPPRIAPPPLPLPRPAKLLPIRHIPIMSKSPLSGERRAFERERVASAMAHANSRMTTKLTALPQANDYYRELAVKERQREIVHVDLHAPLSMPSRATTNDARFRTPTTTNMHPRPMIYQPLNGSVRQPPNRVGHPPLRGFAQHPPGRAFTVQPRSGHAVSSGASTLRTSRPASFGMRPESEQQFASTSFRSTRMSQPSSTSGPGYRIVRPQVSGFTQTFQSIPPPPLLKPMVKKPKVEPKEEPDF